MSASGSPAAVVPSAAVPAVAQARAEAATLVTPRTRIASIDVMRGLVMVLMLVDHVRETIYLHMQVTDPMTLETTSPQVFFTRLSAHLCAPVFVFLTGLSAWLYAHPASGSVRSPRGFLVKRGLLLIALELTVINFAWTGQFPPTILWLQVIWAIGVSMIVLAATCGLPRAVIAALGFVIVFGHNLLTPLHFAPGTVVQGIWAILHERSWLIADGPLKIKVTYPVLPWIGVILLGYAAGPLYSRAMAASRRTRLLITAGFGCLALLVVVRGFNIYGETLPWVAGVDFVHTLMSWLNYTKYPPSLDFLLLTLGLAFLLMAAFEARDNRFTRALAIFGGAPMFFYILHLYVLLILYHVLLAVVGPNEGQRFGVDDFRWVWFVAAAFAVALYLPCRAFAQFKRTTKQGWVRYF